MRGIVDERGEGVNSEMERRAFAATTVEQAFARYGDMVYRLALLRTKKVADAEDIVQEVLSLIHI